MEVIQIIKIDIGIIGGGAAGVISAIAAKRADSTLKIAIFEQNNRILKKLLVTGNGQCNFANKNLDSKFYFSDDLAFANKIFNRFPLQKTLNFFEEIGILPIIKDNGKIYPQSFQASSVVDGLRLTLEYLGVEIYTEFEFEKLNTRKTDYEIHFSNNKKIIAEKIIFASGGITYPQLGGNRRVIDFFKELKHDCTKLSPALVQLKTEKEKIKGLNGMKADCLVMIKNKGREIKQESGEVLFTEFGLSGPPIFNLSIYLHYYENLMVSLDFFPDKSFQEMLTVLQGLKKSIGHYQCENFLSGIINKRIGQKLLKASGVDKLNVPVSSLDTATLNAVAGTLKNYEIKVNDTLGTKYAQVMAGGIMTKNFNDNLESKLLKNIFCAGEMLDVTGECGGFNLQWAWSSGYIVGLSAAASL